VVNYYEILGLKNGASISEIKASFRHLAKIYHPDVNPEGQEHFTKIVIAYETLSDPVLKSSYDYKLTYHQTHADQPIKKPGTKTWKFDEREMKRRQYYNEHFKKYGYDSKTAAEESAKKHYNEFKYILFATPLAAILFLLIMNLATPDHIDSTPRDYKYKVNATQSLEKKQVKLPEPETGAPLYSEYFGRAKYDKSHGKTLTVTNYTGYDAVVVVFSNKEFIRSFYIKSDSSAKMTRLPAKPLSVRYTSGRYFDPSKPLNLHQVKGGFTGHLGFFESLKVIPSDSINELTLLAGENKEFTRIDETTFFKEAIR
jgi:curved DNA-binding protein CbpA